jgi:deoxycytidylate deaminase
VPAQILGDAAKNTSYAQSLLHSSVRNAEALGYRENGLSGFVTTHEIIDVERYLWSGHVYNLETASNWYSVQPGGIIAHNCIHAEQNAVINCDSPRSVDKIIFTTNLPCPMCAKFMINLGNVRMVYYREDYRIRDGLDILSKAGINFKQLIVGDQNA